MPSARQAVAALQSPPGRGGIAVIALSGRDAPAVLAETFCPLADQAASDDELRLGRVMDGGGVIDEAIVTRRGECFEINLHGGSAAARATLAQLARCGATIAESTDASESFPLAHPNWNNPAIGRELLAALHQARSRLVVAALSQQWSAGLSELAARAMAAIGAMAARGHASLEFAPALRAAASRLPLMQRLLRPAEVALAGPPNAGKSTLANVLAGRAVSIVDDTPGTTRDWVREPAIIDGVPIWLTDTAGLWDAPEGIDAEAVQRARQCIAAAELVVLLEAGHRPQVPSWLPAEKVITVAAKADVAHPPGKADVSHHAAGVPSPVPVADVAISARTEQGLPELRAAIVDRLGLAGFDPAVPAAFTARQASLLNAAADAMDRGNGAAANATLKGLLEG